MIVDFCVINPPFNGPDGQGMLHYDFLCKALEVAETVVSIQPATWMNQQKNRAGLPLNGRGATINIIGDSQFLFGSNTSLRYKVCVNCFSNKYKDILVDWGNGNSSRYPDLESISLIDQHSLLKDILEKANQIEHDGILKNHTYGSALGTVSGDTGKIKIKADDIPAVTGKWIVRLTQIMPDIDTLPNSHGILNIDPKRPVVYQHDGSPKFPRVCCMFDTEKEARNCYAYLASDLVRAYCIAYKRGSSTIEIIKRIPWPATFDTDPALWTNEAISDRAGLIPAERSWLKEILPDCYNIRI